MGLARVEEDGREALPPRAAALAWPAVGATVGLLAAPWLAPVVSLLAAAAGIFKWEGVANLLHHALEAGTEAVELVHPAEASYLQQVHAWYVVSLAVGLLGVAIGVSVAALSAASPHVPRLWGRVLEAAAVGLWGVPYWTYNVLMWAASFAVVLLGALGLASRAVTAFKIEPVWMAVVDAFVSAGALTVIVIPTVALQFLVAWVPSYLFWKYAVSVGLSLGRPDGIARRMARLAATPPVFLD